MSDYERFIVESGTVSLPAGTYTNPEYCYSSGAAGEVRKKAMLICEDVTFYGNTSSGTGGAICNHGGITLNDAFFSSNRANRQGGAVYSDSGTVAIIGATFNSNTANREGGAVYNRDLLTITDAVFCNNTTIDYNGGAFYNMDGTASLSNLSFISNQSVSGGAISNDGGTIMLSNVIFCGNTASLYGGAIDNARGRVVTLTGATFCGNIAEEGGAIYNAGGTVTLTAATFSGNTASTSGGAIYNSASMTLIDTVFCNNATIYSTSGAIYNSGMAVLKNVSFCGNTSAKVQTITVSYVEGFDIEDYLGTYNLHQSGQYAGYYVQQNGNHHFKAELSLSQDVCSSSYRDYIDLYPYASEMDDYRDDFIFCTTNDITSAQKLGTKFSIHWGRADWADVTVNALSYGNVIYNGGTILLAGTVSLQTPSDTIYNAPKAALGWDISEDNAGYLDNYSLLKNDGKLLITVDAEQETGKYVLAGNAASATGQAFTLTGVFGQISLIVNGESKKYNALQYTLKTANDDLILTIDKTPKGGVFYNSHWSVGESITVTWHDVTYTGKVGDDKFFNNYDAAQTASTTSGDDLVVMESGTITKSTSYEAQDVTLSSGDVVYNRMVLGGNLQAGNHLDFAGSYTMTVENGTFASDFAGGDAANGYVLRTGDVTVNVSGGTFAKSLAAGSYYATTGSVLGVAAVEGDLTLLISGGSFTGRIYGGNGAMTDQLGSCTALQGNTYLTIDASTNAISFGECVAAGSRGHGIIYGSTNVTVTGNGANLAFADASVLFGGCSGDCYATVGGVRTASTSVMGDRKLTFGGFIGDFNAEIRMFSDITFENNTKLNFADADLDLKEVEKWNFDCTSFASNLNKNQFKGDTISVDTSGLTTSWTLLSGDAAAFADLGSAASVTLGGNTAKWSGSAWSDGTYTLTLDDPKTSLIVTKLA